MDRWCSGGPGSASAGRRSVPCPRVLRTGANHDHHRQGRQPNLLARNRTGATARGISASPWWRLGTWRRRHAKSDAGADRRTQVRPLSPSNITWHRSILTRRVRTIAKLPPPGSFSAMTAGTTPVADALAGAFPWENARTVVDVGWAQDCVPVRLALAHEHLISHEHLI
jgi:hypothetical protein